MFPYLIQGNNITIVIDNVPHTISSGDINYDKVKTALKDKDWDQIRKIINPEKMIIEYGNGNIAVRGDQLFWKDIEMHNSLSTRLISALNEGFDIEPMANFMENLMENPSKRAVSELYEFLEKNTLPITPDGHFLAYKKVRADYLDVHSASVPNRPAELFSDEDRKAMPITCGKKKEVTVNIENDVTVISMPRNFVDDDKDRTCSEGLHFCSLSYLNHFSGDKILILKINPRDVVSIPSDYNRAKGRTSRYEVVGLLGNADAKNHEFQSTVVNWGYNAS
jgi:hypothetical protein